MAKCEVNVKCRYGNVANVVRISNNMKEVCLHRGEDLISGVFAPSPRLSHHSVKSNSSGYISCPLNLMMRPSTRAKLSKLVIAVLLVFLLLRPRWRSQSFDCQIHGKPHDVWEFVSDLGNAKLLNKYIYDFHITSDKGNYGHWEYSAVIYETMAHLPLLTNTNYAHFSIKPATGDENYRISSSFQTCFFKSFCLDSKSEMLFSPTTSLTGRFGTRVRETVEYQCPFALSWFCAWELQDSRAGWTSNLKEQFD